MRRIWVIVLGLWWSLGVGVGAGAADYYVSANGSDMEAGTSPGRAWQTLAQVSRHTFQAGDRVLLRGGDTFAGSMELHGVGTEAKPIALTSYGKGRATINAENGTGVLIRNTGGWSVSNLVVMGGGREANRGSGLVFRNELPNNKRLAYVRVTNVEAQGFGRHGILVEGAASDKSQSGYGDVRLFRCVAHDNAYTGIYVTGVFDTHATRYANANVIVDHCVAYDNPGDPKFTANHSGSGIFLEFVDGGLIDRCVAHDNGALCPCKLGGPIGIWAAACNNITIQHCESHHNRTSDQSLDGGGFDFDGGVTNSTLQYNYSHDNEGAGYLIYTYPDAPYTFRANTVRYNISQNDGRKHHYSGIFVGGDTRDVNVYNNTLFTSPAANSTSGASPCALIVSGGRNIRCFNNILMTTGGIPLLEKSKEADVLLRGNAYWSSGDRFQIAWNGVTYGSLNAFQLATRQEGKSARSVGKAGGNKTGSDKEGADKAVGLEVDPLLAHPGAAPTLNNADLLHKLDAYRLTANSPLINAGVHLPIYYGIHVGEQDFFGDHLPNGKEYDIGAHERK